MRVGCLEMIKDSLGNGCSAKAISEQFMEICSPNVRQHAAHVAAKVHTRWPDFYDTIDIEMRMMTCQQDMILDWISEALCDSWCRSWWNVILLSTADELQLHICFQCFCRSLAPLGYWCRNELIVSLHFSHSNCAIFLLVRTLLMQCMRNRNQYFSYV